MSDRGAQLIRWLLVAIYVVLAWGLVHDGETAGEFVVLLVVGAIFLVVILAAGWISRAGGSDDEFLEDPR